MAARLHARHGRRRRHAGRAGCPSRRSDSSRQRRSTWRSVDNSPRSWRRLTRAGIAGRRAGKDRCLRNAYGHIGHPPVFGSRRAGPATPRERCRRGVRPRMATGRPTSIRWRTASILWPRREHVLVPDRADRVAVEVQVDVTSWPLPVGLPAEDLIGARPGRSASAAAESRRSQPRIRCCRSPFMGRGTAGTASGSSAICMPRRLNPSTGRWCMTRARQARMSRMLNVGLVLAHEVLDSPLPPTAIDAATSRPRRGSPGAPAGGAAAVARPGTISAPPRGERGPPFARTRRRQDCATSPAPSRSNASSARSTSGGASAPTARRGARRKSCGARRFRCCSPPYMPRASTARPIAIGSLLAGVLIAAYIAVHIWAARRVPVRTWSSRNA